MERYFDTKLEKVGSFLSVKFGILFYSWSVFCSNLFAEVLDSSAWQHGCGFEGHAKAALKQQSPLKRDPVI